MPMKRGKICYSPDELRELQKRSRSGDSDYRETSRELNDPGQTATQPLPRMRKPIDRRGAPPRYTPHATRGDYVEDRQGGEAMQRRAREERARLPQEQERRRREIEEMEREKKRRKDEIAERDRRNAAKVAAYQQSVRDAAAREASERRERARQDAMRNDRRNRGPINREGASRYAQAVQGQGDIRERFGEENARRVAWGRYRRALDERAARHAMKVAREKSA